MEGDVAVANLQGDRHEDGIVCHLDIVRADIEVERGPLKDCGLGHVLLQVLELDGRWCQDLRIEAEAVELLTLLRRGIGTVAELFQAAAAEAVFFVGHAHLFVHGQTSAGCVLQRVFLRAVKREVIVVALAAVDELEVNVVADAFDVAVMPDLKREGRRGTAALFDRALVGAATGMRVDAVRLAVCDVDVSAIRSPAGLASGKVLVRVSNAGIVLLAKFIVRRLGIWIAPKPEVLNELLTFFVVLE